jgi:hypothetical protein
VGFSTISSAFWFSSNFTTPNLSGSGTSFAKTVAPPVKFWIAVLMRANLVVSVYEIVQ